MNTIEELEQALRIDKHDLDTCLTEQAHLFFKAGSLYAKGLDARDTLKDELGRKEAELSLYYRDTLEKGKEKFTESKITSMVKVDPDYIEARANHRDAAMHCERCQVLKDSFIQRSFMVRDMANLYVNEYYSTDSIGKKDAATERRVKDTRKRNRKVIEK